MARQSRYLLPIGHASQHGEAPPTDGHGLMVRAGLLRELGEGVDTWLPAGWRAHRRAVSLIRAEMTEIGAHELLMPLLQPADLWERSGRLADPDVFSLTDRRGSSLVLAKGDDEAITGHIAQVVRSYRDLPVVVYQLQVADRDAAERAGSCARESVMLRAYCFHGDADGMCAQIEVFRAAFERILERCGLEFWRLSGASAEDPYIFQGRVGIDACRGGDATAGRGAGSEDVLHERSVTLGECVPVGSSYSRALDATYTDADGRECLVFMGSCALDPARIIQAAVEQFADDHGVSWPAALAPFDVHLLSQAQPGTAGEQQADLVYGALLDAGIDVLYDDRDLAPQNKIADAELLGCPLRLTIAPHSTETAFAAVLLRRDRKPHAGLPLQREAAHLAADVERLVRHLP